MFKKLLKYDYMATKRIGLPVLIAILVAGVLGSVNVFIMKALLQNIDGNFLTACGMILSVLFFVLVFVVIAGGVTAIQVIILIDFYKNLGTDEGYLTFTLPVKTRDLIFSKTTNAGIWNIFSLLAVIVSVGMIIICAVLAIGVSSEPTVDTGVYYGIGTGSVVISIILSIIFSVLYFINSQLLYFIAIFLGTVIAKKNKGIVAVGSVIVVNMIYGTVWSIVSSIFGLISGVFAIISSDPLATMNIMSLIFIVLIGVVDVVFYRVLKNMMENKLNLA